ncbi:hypothetical protein DL93DRAFT_2062450 [Clavulina sp. PMI_390]|nr:hypothetical protein DL93DRAFT_2062450 [Clavulina sp. PMI_390]
MSLGTLFPSPSRPSEFWDQTPHNLPGVTSESTQKLVELLRLNDERYHVFFNSMGFHNHLTHHVLAAWSLGASAAELQQAFNEHASYQRKKPIPPEKITGHFSFTNISYLLSSEKYYEGYRQFFADKLLRPDGISKTLEEFVFSREANHGASGSSSAGPMMLARFYGGVLHPMIHSGYVEFGMPGMLAEGLSVACITNPQLAIMMPPEFFHASSETDSTPGQHSFDIVAEMLQDDRLKPHKIRKLNSSRPFEESMDNVGAIVREYASKWVVPADGDKRTLQSKIEELQWLSAIIFGVGGWRPGHDFRSDFFLMHILTSSIFLPSLAAFLSPSSQSALLRGHFSTLLSYWIDRGRPSLYLGEFMDSVTATPSPPKEAPRRSSSNRNAPPDVIINNNPWLDIIQSVTHHPDEHLVKTIRALQHYARIYGGRPAGTFGATKLAGAERLDGTLFVRVAVNAMNAIGWESGTGGYDRAGLGWDEVWR